MPICRLAFNEDLCFACVTQDCLVRCRHMAIDQETARIKMGKIMNGEDSFVLHDCATCYACEEYGPHGNHPFDLIVQRQDELDIPPLPAPLIKRGMQLCIPFRGEPEIDELSGLNKRQ